MRGAHIIAVTSPDGSGLSTVQFAKPLTAGSLSVVQHRGFRNAEPPPAASAAVKWLVDSAKAGKVKTLSPEAIDVSIAERRAKREADVYEAHDESAVPAYLAWRPYLEKPWKDIDAETVMAKVADVAEQVLL